MLIKRLLILMILLSLLLTACGGDDEDEDDDNGNATNAPAQNDDAGDDAGDDTSSGDVAADAEAALTAMYTGEGADDLASYFCEAFQPGMQAMADGLAASRVEGVEVEYDINCEAGDGSVTCGVTATTAGVAAPEVNYSIEVVDGKLCTMTLAQ